MRGTDPLKRCELCVMYAPSTVRFRVGGRVTYANAAGVFTPAVTAMDCWLGADPQVSWPKSKVLAVTR